MIPNGAALSPDSRREEAIAELTGLVAAHYPSASFIIAPAEDNPGATHITAVVDVEDPDEVLDLVIERELAWQLEEGVPVYVIPVQPPARILDAVRRATSADRPPARAMFSLP